MHASRSFCFQFFHQLFIIKITLNSGYSGYSGTVLMQIWQLKSKVLEYIHSKTSMYYWNVASTNKTPHLEPLVFTSCLVTPINNCNCPLLYILYTQSPLIRLTAKWPALVVLKNSSNLEAHRVLILQAWALAVS